MGTKQTCKNLSLSAFLKTFFKFILIIIVLSNVSSYAYDELPLQKSRFLSPRDHSIHLERLRTEQSIKKSGSGSGSASFIFTNNRNNSIGTISNIDLNIGEESENLSVDVNSSTEGGSNQNAKISNKFNNN